MKLTRFAAALGAVALVGAGVIAVAGPATAGGGGYAYPSPSSTCTPTDDQVIHHDAVTHVVHHDAATHVVHHEAVTHVVHHDAVDATWWNWSPNKDQGPFDGPPAFPTDPRGTWQGPHAAGGPAQDTIGTFLNGNGNGDWFHRAAGTPASDETVVDRDAYDETVVDREAYDETVVDHAAYDETIRGTTCPTPYEDTITVTPFLDYTPPTCDEPGSLDDMGPESGVLWSAVGGSPGPTTFTASPAPGHRFPPGARTRWTVPDLIATGYQSADPYADCYAVRDLPRTRSAQRGADTSDLLRGRDVQRGGHRWRAHLLRRGCVDLRLPAPRAGGGPLRRRSGHADRARRHGHHVGRSERRLGRRRRGHDGSAHHHARRGRSRRRAPMRRPRASRRQRRHPRPPPPPRPRRRCWRAPRRRPPARPR